MADKALCEKIRKQLVRFSRVAYGQDLEAVLTSRGHELWLIGIDTKNKQYIDICGTISPADFAAIIGPGFWNTSAGYKASAHVKLGLSKPADIFLLNTDYFSLDQKVSLPLLVHELAHLWEQIGIAPATTTNDDENAAAIMKSLHPDVAARHELLWARHLAVGARVLIQKNITPYKTIREYLEHAVPDCDRVEIIRAKKGW